MQLHGITSTSTATTATALSAPGAGVRYRVVGLHISAGGAAVVTVGFSATNQRVWNLAANQQIDLTTIDWEGDVNAALTVQSSAAVQVNATADAAVEVSPG